MHVSLMRAFIPLMLQSSSVLKYVDYYSEWGIKHIFGFEVCSAYLSDLKTPAHEAHHRLLVFIVFFFSDSFVASRNENALQDNYSSEGNTVVCLSLWFWPYLTRLSSVSASFENGVREVQLLCGGNQMFQPLPAHDSALCLTYPHW